MLVSYRWLADYVDLPESPEEVAAALTALGLEAAIADDRRGWYGKVVVGKVLTREKHPGADKLSLTTVDVGTGEPLPIVCGAKNVAAGQTVVVATVGAVLPGDFRIEKRKVRGELSLGMICAEEELGLAESSEGIMVLDGEIAPGTPFADAFEVCDTIIEVDLTPNRGDCASMLGVARELAARFGRPLRRPATGVDESAVAASSMIAVDLRDAALCPRYAARVMTGVTVAPSPFWMRRRLAAAGVRAINNIVDVTNYVLMETGHPLHAFDYLRVAEAQIVVRRAAEGERFTTLDGVERTLTADSLVIADGRKPVALAGIMGGQNSEVTPETRDLLIEAACFDPSGIRRTARALGISSESSYRFERGTDVEGLIYAQDRAAALMHTLGGGQLMHGRVDAYPSPIRRREVTLRFDQVERIVGVEVAPREAFDILQRLELEPLEQTGDHVTVSVPHFRHDIEREIDLIEEVARHRGYAEVESSIPAVAATDATGDTGFALRNRVRRHLRSAGLAEGMSYSFFGPDDLDRLLLPEGDHRRRTVALDNPMSAEQSLLRTTLVPGLLGALRHADAVALFEQGRLFEMGEGGAPVERWCAGILLSQRQAPGIHTGRAGSRDFYDLKGTVESLLSALGHHHSGIGFEPSSEPMCYPKRQAAVTVEGSTVGWIGQLHPTLLERYGIDQELFAAELDLSLLAGMTVPVPRHHSFNRLPAAKRDLAVVVDEGVTVGALTAAVVRHGGALLREAVPFDLFRSEKLGEGKKSAAFSLSFHGGDRTLTDEEVESAMGTIIAGLQTDLGATLR